MLNPFHLFHDESLPQPVENAIETFVANMGWALYCKRYPEAAKNFVDKQIDEMTVNPSFVESLIEARNKELTEVYKEMRGLEKRLRKVSREFLKDREPLITFQFVT